MPTQAINRETVSGEALFILRSLKENGRLGRSNKLADVKTALEPSVSREFDAYFFFLRKFHYIAMDREAQLRLTDEGERIAEGQSDGKFEKELSEFFGDAPPPEESTQSGIRAFVEPDEFISDPPPHTDLQMEEAVPPPPPRPRSNKPPQTIADEPLTFSGPVP